MISKRSSTLWNGVVIHNQHSTVSTFWLHRLTIKQCTPQRQQNLDILAMIVLPSYPMVNYQTKIKNIYIKTKKKKRKNKTKKQAYMSKIRKQKQKNKTKT